MFVKVKLYGTTRRLSLPETPGRWQGELPPGTTIAELIQILGSSTAELSNVMMNGQICSLDKEIEEGAEILFVTPMGGG